ncbi:hypothetical protein D9M68_561500 [compost metagenome]
MDEAEGVSQRCPQRMVVSQARAAVGRSTRPCAWSAIDFGQSPAPRFYRNCEDLIEKYVQARGALSLDRLRPGAYGVVPQGIGIELGLCSFCQLLKSCLSLFPPGEPIIRGLVGKDRSY